MLGARTAARAPRPRIGDLGAPSPAPFDLRQNTQLQTIPAK